MQKECERADSDRLIGTNEVASIIGVHHITVYKLLKRTHDPLPAPRRIGTKLVWSERDIRGWIDRLPLRTASRKTRAA